ncbi:MAG: nuclear transport factor 2 family protein [Actinomycetota bacterium]
MAPESESVTDVIGRGFANFSSGDVDTFLETIHPEIVWRTAGLFPGLDDVYEGHEGMRDWWAAFRETWEEMNLSPGRITELDERSALAELHFEARGRDGIEVERNLAQRLTVREGKLYRARSWPSWDAAVAALEEESSR